jgi:hypothetical protein
MHELHHVLLGHTKLFQRLSTADNIVFDAVINSLLCRMFPQPAYVACQQETDQFPQHHQPIPLSLYQ